MKTAYYPGCSNHGTSRDYESSTRLVLDTLGVELEVVPDWVCCGATAAHNHSALLSHSLNAWNLSRAATVGGSVLTTCAACYARLAATNHVFAHDPDLAARVSGITEAPYDGRVRVRHILELLVDEVGLDAVAKHVVKPLAGLKVACYYGCLLTRPPESSTADDTEQPRKMEALLKAVGAEPVEWSHRTECCGAGFTMARTDIVQQLSGRILAAAVRAGADCLAAACPMCQSNLDLRQKGAWRAVGGKGKLPVLYLTELVGLALGHDFRDLGLDLHTTSTKPVTRRYR